MSAVSEPGPDEAERRPAEMQDGGPSIEVVDSVALSDEEIEDRLKDWQDPQRRYETGVFAKYAALVSSASEGAITRPSGS